MSNEPFDLYVILGQRKEHYPGEYAPEALDVADEYTMGENPEWLLERLQDHRKVSGWEAVEVVRIAVPLDPIMQVLRPAIRAAIPATIVP